MSPVTRDRLDRLGAELARLRGDPAAPPDGSIVIPVNAQADLKNILVVLGDVVRYQGKHAFEVVLVINNYPPESPPEEIQKYGAAGMQVVALPTAWRVGELVCLTARVHGARAAASERVILFDADCRIPNPTLLLDWYVGQFDRGAQTAYTRVGYYELRPLWSVRARIAAHHAARWVKRTVLRIPTTRGSNYAVDRTAFLRLYDQGLLTDDITVGPMTKATGGRVAYSGARGLRVLTSGRRFRGGWLKLTRYLRYRLVYNVRVVLPVRTGGARKRQNPYHRKSLR
ncbi:MAG: hypothetical protein ACRDON_13080 [Gaiellaceae bacterium]